MVDSGNTDFRIEMPQTDVSFSVLSAETEGSAVDMIWGILMGLLLGFILLFWVRARVLDLFIVQLWERSVPRRQKIGIVIGVSLNIIVSLVPRHWGDTHR